jgi:hypothetical protein
MPFPVSAALYQRHKDQIIALTNARQRYEPGKHLRGLTDVEIGAQLGITAAEATEIRCIAELEQMESARFFAADEWKQGRFEGRAERE